MFVEYQRPETPDGQDGGAFPGFMVAGLIMPVSTPVATYFTASLTISSTSSATWGDPSTSVRARYLAAGISPTAAEGGQRVETSTGSHCAALDVTNDSRDVLVASDPETVHRAEVVHHQPGRHPRFGGHLADGRRGYPMLRERDNGGIADAGFGRSIIDRGPIFPLEFD